MYKTMNEFLIIYKVFTVLREFLVVIFNIFNGMNDFIDSIIMTVLK